MKWLMVVLSLILSVSMTSVARAESSEKVREVNINGFRVFLVDIEKGNRFGYSFAVPYGSSDDDPKNFGRAHFYEHMYSRGSKLYPGHETLINAMAGFGFERNASTGLSQTMYYGKGNEKSGLEAMRMHLGSLTGPELEASSIAREKATVVNEIVVSAPSRPQVAAFMLPMWLLPEDGHPVKGQLTGTNETLDPMNEEALRELHENIYHAGNVSVAVYANFTDGLYTRDQVIAELSTALPLANEQKPAFKPAPQAPLFAQDKILDLVDDKRRDGYIFLPIADGANEAEVQAFLNILTNNSRDGLEDILRRQLGYAMELSGSLMRIGSANFALIGIDFTAEGYAKRELVSQWIIEAIEAAKTKAFPQGVLDQTKLSKIEAFKKSSTNVDTLVRAYSGWMVSKGQEALLHMDFEKAVQIYDAESLKRGAQAIQSKHKAFSFMGPATSPDDKLSEFFNLKYNIRPWKDSESGLPKFDPASVATGEVKLVKLAVGETAKSGDSFVQNPGFTFVSVANPKWDDRTLHINLGLRTLSPIDYLSLRAFMDVAEQSLKAEVANLSSQGISLGFEDSPTGISLTAKGNTGLESSALEWLIEQLLNLEVSPELLEQFREKEKMSLKALEEGFAGSASFQALGSLFTQSDNGPLYRRQQIENLSPATVETVRGFMMRTSHKTVGVAGSYTDAEIMHLMEAVKTLSPMDLEKAPEQTAPRYGVQSALDYFESWEDTARSDIGLIRLMRGPASENRKDRMALLLVSQLLHEQVFLKNRPLGYVQGVAATALSGNVEHFAFYGQVGKEEDLVQLEKVWDEELGKFLNRQIETAAFEKIRAGLLAQLTEEPSTSGAGLQRALGSIRRSGEPFVMPEFIEIIKALSLEEVYKVADKYLGPKAVRLNFKKMPTGAAPSCEELLGSREALRSQLKLKN